MQLRPDTVKSRQHPAQHMIAAAKSRRPFKRPQVGSSTTQIKVSSRRSSRQMAQGSRSSQLPQARECPLVCCIASMSGSINDLGASANAARACCAERGPNPGSRAK